MQRRRYTVENSFPKLRDNFHTILRLSASMTPLRLQCFVLLYARLLEENHVMQQRSVFP